MDNQTNSVCMITGGSSGIGLATAKRFAGSSAISICGRSLESLNRAEQEILSAVPGARVFCFQADLTDVEQAKTFYRATVSELGAVDVLVNNASMAPLANFEEITPVTFESTINIAVRSLFYLTQLAWRDMKVARKGTVVNVSSLSAVDPFPGFSLYGACKAWMDLITHSLAGEGREAGLRICSVRPGAVETPMLRGLFPDFPAEQCVAPSEIANVIWGCVHEVDQYPSGEAFVVSK